MITTTEQIIEENKRRLEANAARYDPYSGEGSTSVPRSYITIEDSPAQKELWLPDDMLDTEVGRDLKKYGSISEILRSQGIVPSDEAVMEFWQEFIKFRIVYDFEFWAASFVIIKSKRGDIAFVLNRGQRKYLKKLEDMRRAGLPIRIILLKARQWGGSTLTQVYIAWLQLVHHIQWHSAICAHVENTARIVRGMYTKLIESYPSWLLDSNKKFELNPYEGSTKTRYFKPRQCRIAVGSANQPDNLRGDDIKCAHFSEVGLFPSSPKKTPEDIFQSIAGNIPLDPDSLIVMESTAKGVGNFFYREWMRAMSGESAYEPVFVAWFDIDDYSVPIKDYVTFVDSMSPYEHDLFDRGATLEGIAWRRKKAKEYTEEWRFKSEFPSFASEAFQSTGRPYYPFSDVQRLKDNVCAPRFVGEVSANESYGSVRALEGVRFVDNDKGMFKVWKKPDETPRVTNRYIVVVDIGGMSQKSDRSVICVIDRYWMSEGGVPEVVAEWCGHVQHYRLAWMAAQIATWYHKALLVVESNTFDSHKTEGYHGEFILDEIAKYYRNLYSRTNAEQIKQGLPVKWGFHTNASSKVMVCDHQRKVLENDLYIEPCAEAVSEHETLETKENGEIGATEGCHDDRHITRAIGIWVAYKLPAPTAMFGAGSNENIVVAPTAGMATI